MDVFSRDGQFGGRDRGQAAADDYSGRLLAQGLTQELAALGRGGVCHAAGVDDDQVRGRCDMDLSQAETLDKLADLLTLVLVNFTSQC